MSGINTGLEIGKRALLSQQTALNVTAHNIANVSTPGFSRQRPVLEPTPSLNSFGQQVGTGVTVAMIERIYDRFVTAQISSQVQGKGKWDAETNILDQVDAVFNETSGSGLNQALNDFWNAWRAVATNPVGTAERSALVAKTTTLTQNFRDLDSGLSKLQTDLNTMVRTTVQELNLLTQQIAGLNLTIKQLEAGGQAANDARDQRQVLVDKLAEQLPVQVFEQSDGQVVMQLPGGNLLVSGSSYRQLSTTLSGTSEIVQWVDSNGTAVNVTSQLTQGKLGGWIEARDTLLANYRSKLNTLAAGLIKEVNRLHSDGIGLTSFTSLTSTYPVSSTTAPLSSGASLPFGSDIVDGSFQVFVYNSSGTVTSSGTVPITAATTSLTNVQTSLAAISGLTATLNADGTLTISGSAGNTFAFRNDTSNVLMALGLNTLFTGKEARDIAVNAVVSQTPDRLATAQVEASGTFAVGDNRNALAIVGVQTTSFTLSGTSSTLDDFYATLLGQVGIDAQRAERELTRTQAMLDQLTNRREAISGVSLDEEMTNLVKFQQAYAAAAKIISVMDEMMRTVIEMV